MCIKPNLQNKLNDTMVGDFVLLRYYLKRFVVMVAVLLWIDARDASGFVADTSNIIQIYTLVHSSSDTQVRVG